jgi:hypothetical protein
VPLVIRSTVQDHLPARSHHLLETVCTMKAVGEKRGRAWNRLAIPSPSLVVLDTSRLRLPGWGQVLAFSTHRSRESHSRQPDDWNGHVYQTLMLLVRQETVDGHA